MNVTEEGCWNEYLQDADINHTTGRIVGKSLRGLHEFMGKSATTRINNNVVF